jgi:hypothetical protein
MTLFEGVFIILRSMLKAEMAERYHTKLNNQAGLKGPAFFIVQIQGNSKIQAHKIVGIGWYY